MPDPARVVRKSHGTLTRLGYSSDHAYTAIATVAVQCAHRLRCIGIDDLTWLEQIAAAAESRAGSRNPSRTDHQESEHADGTGRGTGGTENYPARTTPR